jgi:hypothetical protein
MKPIIHKFIVLVACVFGSQAVFGQPNGLDTAGGLNVSAFSSSSTNSTNLSITVVLLNTTNHDITVLTKNGRSHYWNMASDNTTNFWYGFNFEWGSKIGDHRIIPSLTDLAPVTIKPNEVALCHMLCDKRDASMTLHVLTKDSPIVISYDVSIEMGARFGCWSGHIQTKPFHIP